ncbi:flagellar biosynthesis protein FlgA [Micromonospora sp. C28SCA-DRY-2]|uniref:flagellar biosynthesis protein FlgA n=1 Tax=Micromonospora sp. C28SCA-DRY-2 TaxID=3059522 RepID=UPI00267457EF|nr:flagellar biosynthesis protein FlgA [Micromonospora sp. C28SCA-DRY-2]MDO3701354.1 flagellar biosynthesis protein FlgA [Micromonospora sp. C28SCA-DRY-2]
MASGDAVSARALRPLRRPRLPRRTTLFRAGLAAALLGLAAAVLHTPAGCPPGPAGSRPPPAAPSGSPDGAPPRAAGTSVTGHPAGRQAGSGDRSGVPGGVDQSGALDGRDRPGTGPGGGETVAGPDGRPAPLPLPSGAVGVPVGLAEPAALAVVRPGTRIDLLAVPPGADGPGILLASRALVLDVLGADALDAGAALYLALPPDQARRAVSQPEGSRFAVVVRG